MARGEVSLQAVSTESHSHASGAGFACSGYGLFSGDVAASVATTCESRAKGICKGKGAAGMDESRAIVGNRKLR